MNRPPFAEVYSWLLAGALSPSQVRSAFDAILSGEWTDVQVGAFAAALRLREESFENLVAGAEALRAAMTPLDHGLPLVLDTCGTGGDGAHTVNVSTAVAVVVAAAGLPVAKHGNRSVSSRCGSADVVEALGIPLDLTPSAHLRVLTEAQITFLMAPLHHPALRYAAKARKELGVRTMFNALGPLANPARATHQLVGVYADELRPNVAKALGRLGVSRAWVVRSDDGLDEISPFAPTRISELREDGSVVERVVTPSDFGFAMSPAGALAGGSAEDNARALVSILSGDAHPARPAVVMNAAAALHIGGRGDITACVAETTQLVDSGRAHATLERWRAAARGAG